jgi:predicted dehydrogenase
VTSTAIVGAGAIAYAHAQALMRLGVEIHGVIDVNRNSAAKLAASCGSRAVDRLDEVVEGLDLVHICTPPSYRIDYARTAMAAGCHVVMEKPMAITLADARTLVDLAREHRVQLMIDFNHRFRAGFQELLRVVRSGAIGEVVNVHIQRFGMLGGSAGTANDTWRRRPDTVCGMAIESLAHDIDMVIQLAGPIAAVQADVRGTLPDVPRFDNNVNALLALKSGAMASMVASWSSHLKGSVRGVTGTAGGVSLEGDDSFDFMRLKLRTSAMAHEQTLRIDDRYDIVTCPSYLAANRHFIESVQQRSESSVSGAYALETLRVSHAILDAAASRSAVEL